MKKIKAGYYKKRLVNDVTVLVLKDVYTSKWFFRLVDIENKYVIYESEYYTTKTICIAEVRYFVEQCYGLEL